MRSDFCACVMCWTLLANLMPNFIFSPFLLSFLPHTGVCNNTQTPVCFYQLRHWKLLSYWCGTVFILLSQILPSRQAQKLNFSSSNCGLWSHFLKKTEFLSLNYVFAVTLSLNSHLLLTDSVLVKHDLPQICVWGQHLCPQSASSFLFFIYKVDVENCCLYNSNVAINVPFFKTNWFSFFK